MHCLRSLRRQIPRSSLRALSTLCSDILLEAHCNTMAVAEPAAKKAKTEYNHTREVRHWIKSPALGGAVGL